MIEARTARRSLERTVVRLVLIGGLPAVVSAIWLVWVGPYGPELRWTLTTLLPAFWLGAAAVAWNRTLRPLQLLVNLLGALREGDYSLRGAGAGAGDPLGDVLAEVNALGDTLHRQRLSAVEATALLSSILREIDVAIFAFDEFDRLRVVNRAAADLLQRSQAELLGLAATDVGLGELLTGDAPRTVERAFPGGRGRWEIRRSEFRQDGRPHRLLVLADLSRALREEERQAWQRIVRVLSHEINNSLAPIQSIARSVRRILDRELADSPRVSEVYEGLDVIAGRAGSLGKLMSEYARLAKLPAPKLRPVNVEELIRGVVGIEQRVPVRVVVPSTPDASLESPDSRLMADRPQLEQALINLVRNAADASLETAGEVRISWHANEDAVEIRIEDDGPGIENPGNLFVPFFTTKPDGSGIGLALSRQIAEAHGGSLTLENRTHRTGARAVLRIPIAERA